ncbi:hypothetical protein [Maritimibacter alkaliphilus]|uniref:Transferrin-binding protein B C-lobe/N-lobe beta barrel domain-containing protein n=1 Tax=Maritimibacter alkaliphilus HTCC2654 TaxID=314271 RepID=A3VMU4_9RHOB|nr:hypothetical protein [Maritimibacter alkaliphilus]EAQ10424.1 hypothetical protein RB2654_05475 [Rhodobacterales bacterium HTCC2654] [Maritimibacter alkaliphilus HTCC2654]TYP81665.1 hypothetical protein BD830_105333 [Maritimibacter alkaliphilus HTCC2654]
MKLKLSGLLVTALALSACATSTTGVTTTTTTTTTTTSGSGSVTTTSSEVVLFDSRELPNAEARRTLAWSNVEFGAVNDTTLGGVDFVVGTQRETARGYTGVRAGTDIGVTVATGTATYTTDYTVLQLDNLTSDGTNLSGDLIRDSGQIVLTADFDTGGLTGTDKDLVVAGTIAGDNLGGAVTYRSTAGILGGNIGDKGVAGAFHGSGADTVFAGGFIGPQD